MSVNHGSVLCQSVRDIYLCSDTRMNGATNGHSVPTTLTANSGYKGGVRAMDTVSSMKTTTLRERSKEGKTPKLEPPKFVHTPKDLTVEQGKRIELSVKVTGKFDFAYKPV